MRELSKQYLLSHNSYSQMSLTIRFGKLFNNISVCFNHLKS